MKIEDCFTKALEDSPMEDAYNRYLDKVLKLTPGTSAKLCAEIKAAMRRELTEEIDHATDS